MDQRDNLLDRTLKQRMYYKKYKMYFERNKPLVVKVCGVTALVAALINGWLQESMYSLASEKKLGFNPLRTLFFGTIHEGAFPIFVVIWFFLLAICFKAMSRYLLSKEQLDDRDFIKSYTNEYDSGDFMNDTEKKGILHEAEVSKLTGNILGINNESGLPMEIRQDLPKKDQIGVHAAIFGSSGMRKTRSIVMPWLLQMIKRNESFICTDPKGEIYKLMAGYARKCGYKVKVFNLVNPIVSDSCNFLGFVGDDTMKALSLAEVIIANTSGEDAKAKGDFWENGERAYLTFGILYVSMTDTIPKEEKTLGKVYEFLVRSPIDEIQSLAESLDDDHPAKKQWDIFQTTPENLRGNIITGLATRIQLLNENTIRQITSYDEIDLSAPGKEKCAYFVIVSDQENTLNYVAAMFFSFLFIELVSYADGRKSQSCKVPVNMMLDEFPNVCKIPGFKQKLNTIRSRDIRCTIIAQDIGQMKDCYPGHGWESIISSCDIQILLGLNEHDTNAKWWSNKTGEMTIETSSERVNRSTGTLQESKAKGRRKVLTENEIMTLGRDYELIFVSQKHVLKAKKFDYSQHPYYKELIEENPVMHTPNWWKYCEGKSWFITNKAKIEQLRIGIIHDTDEEVEVLRRDNYEKAKKLAEEVAVKERFERDRREMRDREENEARRRVEQEAKSKAPDMPSFPFGGDQPSDIDIGPYNPYHNNEPLTSDNTEDDDFFRSSSKF